MKTIVTLTINPCIDKSTTVDHVVPERKLRCGTPHHQPGGGGVNVSRAIHNLGGESLALYPAGGTVGQRLRNLLDQEGISHRWTPIEGTTRENLMVMETATGQQYRFGMPGASMHEGEWKQILEEVRTIVPSPDYLVASGSLPPGVPDEFYVQAARIAREIDSKIIVDTSGEALCSVVRNGGVYMLKPNMREVGDLVGHPIKDDQDLEQSALDIVRSGKAEVLIVSQGAGGALLVTKEGHTHVRAPSVPIRSKVGAGDSMVAGTVLSLARGKAIPEAVRFGVAAGSAAVMAPGMELCTREDTERLYRRITLDRN